MPNPRVHVLQGMLDMLILKTLAWGPNHGFGILRHLEQVTEESLVLEEGALYPALHRLHERGLVEAEWGVTENKRRARYYELSPAGERELQRREREWSHLVEAISAVLQPAVAT